MPEGWGGRQTTTMRRDTPNRWQRFGASRPTIRSIASYKADLDTIIDEEMGQGILLRAHLQNIRKCEILNT